MSSRDLAAPTGAGLHLVLDLAGCRCDPALLRDGERIRDALVADVGAVGLQCVGSALHVFGEGGYTCAVLLAESHLTVHTWPEHDHVSADVYVCNHQRDNAAKARALAERLVRRFEPEEPHVQPISRAVPRALGAPASHARRNDGAAHHPHAGGYAQRPAAHPDRADPAARAGPDPG